MDSLRQRTPHSFGQITADTLSPYRVDLPWASRVCAFIPSVTRHHRRASAAAVKLVSVPRGDRGGERPMDAAGWRCRQVGGCGLPPTPPTPPPIGHGPSSTRFRSSRGAGVIIPRGMGEHPFGWEEWRFCEKCVLTSCSVSRALGIDMAMSLALRAAIKTMPMGPALTTNTTAVGRHVASSPATASPSPSHSCRSLPSLSSPLFPALPALTPALSLSPSRRHFHSLSRPTSNHGQCYEDEQEGDAVGGHR